METKEMRRLRNRARKLHKAVRLDRATGGYLLIDLDLNAVVGGPMDLEDIKARVQWWESQS